MQIIISLILLRWEKNSLFLLCVSSLLLMQSTSLLTLLVPTCVGSPHPPRPSSSLWYSWVSYKFTSDPVYLEIASDPTEEELPQHCFHGPNFRYQSQSHVTSTSDRLALNLDSHECLLGFNNLVKWLTQLREILLFTGLL